MGVKDSALVTLSQIAELAAVSPSAVSNWRRRLPDFPHPREEAPGGRDLYALDEVEAWLERTGRVKPTRDYASLMFEAAHRLRGVVVGDEVVEVIAAALTLVHSLGDGAFGEQLHPQAAIEEASRSVDDGDQVFRPLSDLPEIQAREIVELVAQIPAKTRATVLEWVLSKRSRFIDTRTSAVLSTLLIELAVRPKVSLLDPAAGEGGFLLHAARHVPGKLNLFGQELNEAAWRIARQRMLINEVKATVKWGDSLVSDAFPEPGVDVVLCDPPYGSRADVSLMGGPWEFGPPEPKNADFAWVQHVIRHLDNQGRGYVLLPTGSLFRGGNAQRVRTEIIARKSVEAVVLLPAGAADFTSIPLALWIVRRPDQPDQPGEVLIVDATETTLNPRTSAKVAGTIRTLLDSWRAKSHLPDTGNDLSVAAVPILELLRADANLSPARWTRVASTVGLAAAHDQLNKARDSIVMGLDILESANGIEPNRTASRLSWVPVRDLVEADILQVVRSVRVPPESCLEAGVRALRPRDIKNGRIREDEPCFVNPTELRPQPVKTEPGDIVLSPASGRLSAIVDDVGGHVLATPLQGLRVIGDWIDPALAAALLASPRNRRFAKGTAYARVDIRDVELPSAAAPELEQLPRTIQALDDLQRAATEMSQAAGLIKEGLLERVTSGGNDEIGETHADR